MKHWPNIGEARVQLDFGADGVFEVGTLGVAGRDTFFEYDAQFLRGPSNPSPLHLAFEPSPHIVSDTSGNLNRMFADALPDGWTRNLVDARVADAGFDPRTLTQLDRLALVGGNGAGALSFRPAHDLPAGMVPLTLEDLAATIMRTGQSGDAGIEAAEKFAASLGGVRPKAAIWLAGDAVHLHPVPGGTPWIVKFPSRTYDQPDDGVVEYAYSLMAKAAGIQMAETRLLPTSNGPGYFATARFDRVDDRRYHYQSFGGLHDLGVLDPSSYVELLGTERHLTGGTRPTDQMIRRLAFNVLAVNRDDHVKNHGFLMNAKGIWIASPAFDLTPHFGERHQLVVGSNASSPGISDMVETARSAGASVREARRIVEEVQEVVRRWPTFAREAGLDETRSLAIQEKINTYRRAAMDYDRLLTGSSTRYRSLAKGPADARPEPTALPMIDKRSKGSDGR